MAKTYWLTWKLADGSLFSNASPTFVLLQDESGSTATPPGVTQLISGTGAYQFSFAGSTLSYFFRVDGGASLGVDRRYIDGVLDPLDTIDQKIGTLADSIGSTSADPSTIFGYVKRLQELHEGNATYIKSTGIWTLSSRGSSTVLREKALTNDSVSATKT